MRVLLSWVQFTLTYGFHPWAAGVTLGSSSQGRIDRKGSTHNTMLSRQAKNSVLTSNYDRQESETKETITTISTHYLAEYFYHWGNKSFDSLSTLTLINTCQKGLGKAMGFK